MELEAGRQSTLVQGQCLFGQEVKQDKTECGTRLKSSCLTLDATGDGLISAERADGGKLFSMCGLEFAEKSACKGGYSEHNTGLAMDCDIFRNMKWAGIALDENGNTNEQTDWLHGVLHKFGFILRYPKGKEEITKMKFEPWHIRYVQEEPAKYIYENSLTLEEYHQEIKN